MTSPEPPAPLGGRAFGVPSRRERIIAILAEAYARDELEQREYERRVERAEAAETIEELELLIADFPTEARSRYGVPEATTLAPGSAPAVLSQAEIEQLVARLDGEPAPTRFSLLGDLRVAPGRTDPRVLRAVSAVGDTHLDLRPLAGEPGVYLLKIASLVGSTRITVPAGTRVDIRCFTLVGQQKQKEARRDGLFQRLRRRLGVAPESEERQRLPPAPVVVITGFKLVGDVIVVEDRGLR